MYNEQNTTREDRLFVSYSRKDSDWIKFIEKELIRGGYSVWWDKRLKVAQDWWDTICSEIKKCDFFLFVLTPDSVESVFCMGELEWAFTLRKPILPIIPDYHEDFQIPNKISSRRIQCKHIDEPQYFLYEVETGICDLKLLIARQKGEPQIVPIDRLSEVVRPPLRISEVDIHSLFAPLQQTPNLPFPPLPRLTQSQVYQAWIEVDDAVDRLDINTALNLLDQIIYADPNGLGTLAQEKRKKIKNDIEQNRLYQKIKKLVEIGRLNTAYPLWVNFHQRHPNYDPNNLANNFDYTVRTVGKETINQLKQEMYFDDELDTDS